LVPETALVELDELDEFEEELPKLAPPLDWSK
jgi:hypothetical protein